MLGKLLKNEFKATARLLVPLYLILLVLTIVDRIVLRIDLFKNTLAVIPGFITFAYVISIIAIVAVTFILMILRFYKNLFTDEGYLMFTLPVKSQDLINSKLIVSSIWSIASFVAVIASIIVVAYSPENMGSFREIFSQISAEFHREFGNMTALFIIEIISMIVFGLLYGIMIIYVSIAIGQLFNGHKVIGSFAAYIGISMALQIILTIISSIAALSFHGTFEDVSAVPQVLFPCILLFMIVTSGVFYVTTNVIFKKKLNLE